MKTRPPALRSSGRGKPECQPDLPPTQPHPPDDRCLEPRLEHRVAGSTKGCPTRIECVELKVGQGGRKGAPQVVIVEPQIGKAGQLAEFGRDRPRQRVVAQSQVAEVGELAPVPLDGCPDYRCHPSERSTTQIS